MQLEVSKGSVIYNPNTPNIQAVPSSAAFLRRRIDCMLAFAEQQFKQGNRDIARRSFRLLLKIDPGNEQALLSLCKLTEDLNEQEQLLELLLQFHPENEVALTLLQEMEALRNRSNKAEVEEMIQSSAYLKLWDERIKRHEDRLRYNIDRRTAPISKIGELLLKAGYITQEQLTTALSIQAMLERLNQGQKLGQILLSFGYITSQQLEEVLQIQELEFRSQMY
jgi:tetratricopeptide (TPR) repeat protein